MSGYYIVIRFTLLVINITLRHLLFFLKAPITLNEKLELLLSLFFSRSRQDTELRGRGLSEQPFVLHPGVPKP